MYINNAVSQQAHSSLFEIYQMETASLRFVLQFVQNYSQINRRISPLSLLDITDFDLLPDDTDNLIWRNSQKVLRTFTLACVQDDDLSFKLTPNYEHICNS